MFPSVIMLSAKKALKALKSTLATLRPLETPPAGSTRSISDTRAYLYTTSVTFKAFTVNKQKTICFSFSKAA